MLQDLQRKRIYTGLNGQRSLWERQYLALDFGERGVILQTGLLQEQSQGQRQNAKQRPRQAGVTGQCSGPLSISSPSGFQKLQREWPRACNNKSELSKFIKDTSLPPNSCHET